MSERGPDGLDQRWYGRRRGKRLRPGRRDLIETLLPRLRIDVPAGDSLIDPATLFDRPVRRVWLEIGFGGGEHLAAQAEAHPDVGFIGCEAYLNGVASMLAHVAERDLGNVRIRDEDARPLLDRLPAATLGRVFLLFPDPWPKNRHAGRRFIQTGMLDRLAGLMADGAELRVASDDMGYIRWTLEHATRHPDLHWPARRPADWRDPPADWMPTRYEAKARRQGRPCVYLTFLRRPRTPAAA